MTGVTGFVGGMVARYLLAAGWRVRALVRSGSRTRLAMDPAVESVSGSLEDRDSLRRLVTGTHALIHCAGAVRGATREQFDHVNVKGVAQLTEIASEQQSGLRFLLISSLAAREPQLSHYAASKRQGEETLARLAGDMEWAAFRPPAVYGPGDKELLPLLQWGGRGIGLLLAPTNARISLIYVEDLAAAVLRWLTHGEGVRGIFELHDGHPGGYTWNDVMDVAEKLCCRRIRRIPVPAGVLRSLATVSVLVARMGRFPPMLTPGKVRELRHRDWVCDNEPLRRATDWEPRFPLEEGLRRTPGWRTEAS